MITKANKPHVEGSTENLVGKPAERTFTLQGLEDIPRSIIPVPFYKFVQPNTDKAFLPDGKRAENGTFLMQDVRKTVTELRVLILRAKRAVRMQKNDAGVLEKVVSLQLLAINLERQRPFILSVPITSFAALGHIFEQLELKGAAHSWDYPVYLTSQEISKPKETPQGLKNVTYWVVDASLEPTAIDEKAQTIASEMYQDFAGKLDRDTDDEDELEAIAGKS